MDVKWDGYTPRRNNFNGSYIQCCMDDCSAYEENGRVACRRGWLAISTDEGFDFLCRECADRERLPDQIIVNDCPRYQGKYKAPNFNDNERGYYYFDNLNDALDYTNAVAKRYNTFISLQEYDHNAKNA